MLILIEIVKLNFRTVLYTYNSTQDTEEVTDSDEKERILREKALRSMRKKQMLQMQMQHQRQ